MKHPPVTQADVPWRTDMFSALDAAVTTFDSNTGWIFEGERLSLQVMRARSEQAAGLFHTYGVGPGDRVAVWLPNDADWVTAFFACARLGAVLVPLNTRWTTLECAQVLENCGPRLVLFRPRFLKADHAASLRLIYPDLDSGEWTKAYRQTPRTHVLHVGRDGIPSWVRPFRKGISQNSLSPPVSRPGPDHPLLIQYTSGTTARPKGAVLSHTHVLNFGVDPILRMGVKVGETVLNTQPLFHVGGSCAAVPLPVVLGCSVAMPEYYSPELVLQTIQAEKCVARGGMPTMYLREMAHPRFCEYDVSSLRAGWTIGAPELLEKIRTGYPLEHLFALYGSSEAAGAWGTVTDSPDVRINSVGLPYSGAEVAVDAGYGPTNAPAHSGEIIIRGWARMMGYYDESQAEGFDDKGWFRTGDIGHFDSEGRLYFDGRHKDVVKPGGENVSALEVESVLVSHPEIVQAAVVGVADPDLGEAVVACVEQVAGSGLQVQSIIEHCRQHLSPFKVPKHIVVVADWPITGSGKLNKNELAARMCAELGGPR